MKLQTQISTSNLYLTSKGSFGTDFIEFLTENGITDINANLNGVEVSDSIYTNNIISSGFKASNRVLATKEDITITETGAFDLGFDEGFDIVE